MPRRCEAWAQGQRCQATATHDVIYHEFRSGWREADGAPLMARGVIRLVTAWPRLCLPCASDYADTLNRRRQPAQRAESTEPVA